MSRDGNQHLYDLNTRADRVLLMPVPGMDPPDVQLAGDLLIGTTEYDIVGDRPVSLFSSFPTVLTARVKTPR